MLVVACASGDSGVPAHWAATAESPGAALLTEPASSVVDELAAWLSKVRRTGDVLVVSVHWGGNWGYEVPAWQRDLARALVDTCHADVVFGHSSHHPKALERHRGRLILYGCGDLINDYEGIGGHEEFPTHLALGYFVEVPAAGGQPVTCRMRPYEIRRFRLQRAGEAAADRLARTLVLEDVRRTPTISLQPGGDMLVTSD